MKHSDSCTVDIVRFNPRGNHDLTQQVVKCYQEVFADDPWNEWKKCPICKEYWGRKDEKYLKETDFIHCNVPVEDFWSDEEVIKDLLHEINQDKFAWVGIERHTGRAISFCWGYPIQVSQLEEKLGIAFRKELMDTCGDVNVVAYQDDMGILPKFRSKPLVSSFSIDGVHFAGPIPIARAMFLKRFGDFLQEGLRVGVVRTRERPVSSKTYEWFTKKLGYSIIVKYPGEDGRVILARKYSKLLEII
ncbi:MAG: hypothetical protein AABX72_03160 [Nanoarchaeota archaeon]